MCILDIKGGAQMEYVVIPDTAIVAVNCGRQENEASSIIYRDKRDKWYTIDFETCALNYKAEHKKSSGMCIGERKMDECYFVFYTSGIKTKVVFEKMYVGNLFHRRRLYGDKATRFLELWNLINKTNYTTYDLS